MSQCAIPGCFDPCRSRQLMCTWHWRKVPTDIKAPLTAAWKAYNDRAPKLHANEALNLIGAYRTMVKVAVAYVCGLEGINQADAEAAE